MSVELPPLPEPAYFKDSGVYPPLYTADQLRAAVDAALEAAAVACENERVDAEESGAAEDRCYNYATKHCAAAIRAMRSGVEHI